MNAQPDYSNHPRDPLSGDPLDPTTHDATHPAADASSRYPDDVPQETGDKSYDTIDAAYASAADRADDPESRDEAMIRMRHEVEQSRQRVLIAQAELENFRKRTRKDYEEQLRFAAMPLVEDLLLVRDNLARAIDAAAAASGATDGLRAGVEMVVKQFDDAMAKHGISPINSVGVPFDPNLHQAISQMPSQQHPDGVVAIEATTGFTMHGRVIRPSQVVVSTGGGQV
ncbi:MAG TPA: nucleotide exchange factor GrpE [Planctomycetaceae bacterium]|nr:nucleotide exchange factor GrpE [Planctomycetaceae bacterium]